MRSSDCRRRTNRHEQWQRQLFFGGMFGSLWLLLPLLVAGFHTASATTHRDTDTVLLEDPDIVESSQQRSPKLRRRTSLLETRVVGGTAVNTPSRFPFFAQLADMGCGATLIHDDILISAAHCERKSSPFYKRVFMETTELRKGGIERYIQYMQGHPAYLPNMNDYDFLLIRLTESALVDENGNRTGAKILAFNHNGSVPQDGDVLRAIGFGTTEENGKEMSPVMRQVEIDYISDATCQREYGGSVFNGAVQFCSGVPGGGKDTCQGDSGGPVVDLSTETLVGAVSYGVGCARANFAGVNARVSAVADWIDEWICENSAYPPETCLSSSTNTAISTAAAETYTMADSNTTLNTTNTTMNATIATSNANSAAADTTTTKTSVGAFTLHVELDDYPQEFTMIAQYLGNKSLLALVMPGDEKEERALLEYNFQEAEPGQYLFEFGDEGGDGICCMYGNGSIWITNDLTGEEVYKNNGAYKQYLRVLMKLDANGTFAEVSETEHYTLSYKRVSIPNYPPDFDPEWPGRYPEPNRSAFTVNIKFDAYPQEVDFMVYQDLSGAQDFAAVQNLSGNDWSARSPIDGVFQSPNILNSYEYDDMESGWYWLKIRDSKGNGICCQYRRGWASVTAPVITTQNFGLVWGSDGEFGKGVDAYFKMDKEGFVSELRWGLVEGSTSPQRSGGTRSLLTSELNSFP